MSTLKKHRELYGDHSCLCPEKKDHCHIDATLAAHIKTNSHWAHPSIFGELDACSTFPGLAEEMSEEAAAGLKRKARHISTTLMLFPISMGTQS